MKGTLSIFKASTFAKYVGESKNYYSTIRTLTDSSEKTFQVPASQVRGGASFLDYSSE